METVVFVSSVIQGFQDRREAVRRVVLELQGLGFPVRATFAEDHSASGASPRGACLGLVRESNAVVLLLGPRYGTIAGASGLSVTHEEYREARNLGRPVIAFIERCEREDEQTRFVEEVEDYLHGNFRAAYDTVGELEAECRKALLVLLSKQFSAEPNLELAEEFLVKEYTGAISPARRKLLQDLKDTPIFYRRDLRSEEGNIDDSWEALLDEARALHRRGYAEITKEGFSELGIHWRYPGLQLAQRMQPYVDGKVERLLLLRVRNEGGRRAEHVQCDYSLLSSSGATWGKDVHRDCIGFVNDPGIATELGWGKEPDTRLMLNGGDQAWIIIRFPYEELRWLDAPAIDELPLILRVSVSASNAHPAVREFKIDKDASGGLAFASVGHV